jgi:hypothetical protein
MKYISWYKKNHTTSLGEKCPKKSILVTNNTQEIGTGHRGRVTPLFSRIPLLDY